MNKLQQHIEQYKFMKENIEPIERNQLESLKEYLFYLENILIPQTKSEIKQKYKYLHHVIDEQNRLLKNIENELKKA